VIVASAFAPPATNNKNTNKKRFTRTSQLKKAPKEHSKATERNLLKSSVIPVSHSFSTSTQQAQHQKVLTASIGVWVL
jgi:hypothetical protein